MRLLDLLETELVVPHMRSQDKWDAIEELVDRMVEAHEVGLFDRQAVLDAVLARERLQSTGLNRHVALPHARTRCLEDPAAILGISAVGIPFDSADGSRAHFICLLLIPEPQYRDYLKVLADVARLLAKESLQQQLLAAGQTGTAQDVLNAIQAVEGTGFSLS